MTYAPPIRELTFSLFEVAGMGRLPCADADEAGPRCENGRVFSPPGFPQAYQAFAEGGWNGLAADPDHGGQGLPKALALAVFEMVDAANMAFGLCPKIGR